MIDKIILAIPDNQINLNLKEYLKINNFNNIYAGSSNNVLSRYYYAAKKFSSKIIIRVTADCPLIDYQLLDKMIKAFNKDNLNYLSNTITPTFPDGYDIEIFDFSTLEKTFKNAKSL